MGGHKKSESSKFLNTFSRALLLSAATFPLAAVASAQDLEAADESEVITVTGSRQVIQNSIDIKRESTTIVDGLTASDIGDLPALSIGEALENITGAASHRENGGATEISIRGLGPFLSATTFNGREATNGSGDRSVNFSQFPSELMNRLLIYKTQDASLIEGGVAGLIELSTLRPLDYDRQRFQLDLRGNYNPDQLDIEDTMAGDIGYRTTLSYVDQFELDGLGEFGVSFGLQRSDISQPEAEMRSSSPSGTSLFACLADPLDPSQGFSNATPTDDDCEDNPAGSGTNGGFDTSIDPITGLAVDDGRPFAFAGSSRGFRQNDTRDQRDSVFAALQWQPNNRWDINLDMQWSQRTQSEDRYDLNFANTKRNTRGVTNDSLVITDTGAVLNWTSASSIESNGEIYERDEEYFGIGLAGRYFVTDRLTASADVSFSETTRTEHQVSLRTASGGREEVNWNRENTPIHVFTVTDFDVTDPANFFNNIRARIDTDVDRTYTVNAGRLDFEYAAEWGPISSIEAGYRVSELHYLNIAAGGSTGNGSRVEYTLADSDPTAAACATGFRESGFLSGADAGPLVTNVDGSGNVIGTSNSWAIFDNTCLINAILAGNGVAGLTFPSLTEQNSGTTDVTETTNAFYVMANYDTEIGAMPLRGNVGVRVVNTEVDSVGYRTEFEVVTAPDSTLSLVPTGNIERVSGGGDYTEVLPSFNAVLNLRDDLILRGGIFRGISRADPADMNFARSFTIDDDNPATTLEELVTGVNGSGNPNTDPLTSWNYDIAAEWYPNDDTILALGFYWKSFRGGFEFSTEQETYVIDGQSITLPVVLTQTNEDTSNLFGVELTASHNLSYLPGFWSGFGGRLSYNYADSDFEFEDSLYGDRGFRDASGEFVQTHAGIIAPGNIPGFSEHTLSAQVYYQNGPFDGALIYKYRSEYFQPYTSNGTRLRYVGDVGVWEARFSYELNDNVRLSLEAINLFDEPKEQYFFTHDNLGEANYYGPRVFFGVRVRN